MAKMVEGSDNSAQNLAKTIHSLLGMNTHLNSNWVSSVCDILQNLPSTASSSDRFKEDDDSQGTAISKLKGMYGHQSCFTTTAFVNRAGNVKMFPHEDHKPVIS